MQQLVIIGQGPAGISAAIYAVRSGTPVTVVAKDLGAMQKADVIENYYGFPEAISATELLNNGIMQAKNLGVNFINAEVYGIEYAADGFIIKSNVEDISATAVIIACGMARNVPKIQNIEKFEGKGVSYCAICDAFFYRNKKVAVVGSGQYTLHEYQVLKNVIQDVTILTNGESPSFTEAHNPLKIKSFEGDETIKSVVFEDGTSEEFDGIFIASGSVGPFELSKKVGLQLEKNKIVVDSKMQTNVPAIYACGDCVAGLMQAAKAVYEGMVAGIEASRYIKSKK